MCAASSSSIAPPAYREGALHRAAQKGKVEKVRDLLALGARVDALDGAGRTPLHLAASAGQLGVMRELLTTPFLNALLNFRDFDRMTPLECAIEAKQFEATHLLWECEARSNLTDFEKKTPLELAFQSGDDSTAWWILFGKSQSSPSPSSPSSSPSSSSSQTKSREREAEDRLTFAYQMGDLEEQVFSLVKRAFFFLEAGNSWYAALTLNSASVVAQAPSIPPQCRRLLSDQLEQIESHFVSNTLKFNPSPNYSSKTSGYRLRLDQIRQTAESSLSAQEPVHSILNLLTQGYKELLTTILLDSIEASGQRPPTRFAMAGLGSMSRGEMAPYSDVEFIFLLEKDTEENRLYFRSIARLMALKIANLGETEFKLIRIRTSDGELSEKSLSPNGFSMDIGGLSPLGKEGLYELIGSPEPLARFQTSQWFNDHSAEIILVNAMTKVCFIEGDERLVLAYQKRVSQILNSGPLFSWLPIGQRLRETRAVELMRSYLEEFQPRLNKDRVKLRGFDVKKDLYRLPQGLIAALALHYNLKSSTTFDQIDELRTMGVINQFGATNLKRALSTIFSLRLTAHFFYRTEREVLYLPRESRVPEAEGGIIVSPELDDTTAAQIFEIHRLAGSLFRFEEERDPEAEGLFIATPELNYKIIEIYRTLVPLQKAAELFLTGDQNSFNCSLLYDRTVGVFDDTQRVHLQFDDALQSAESSLALNPNSTSSRIGLGLVQKDLGAAKLAIENFSEVVLSLKNRYPHQSHPDTASALSELGAAYADFEQYSQAINCYREALSMLRELHKNQPQYEVAILLNLLGNAYRGLNDYDRAISYLKNSLEMFAFLSNKTNSVETSYGVAMTLSNLAIAYNKLSDYQQAIDYYRSAFKNFQALYHHRPHPDLAVILMLLGDGYNALGDYSQALDYFQSALKMNEQIYQKRPHPSTAMCLGNIGLVHSSLGNYGLAVTLFNSSLDMFQKIYEEEPHEHIAMIWSNLGLAYRGLGHYDDALKSYLSALGMFKEIYQSQPNTNLSTTLLGLGSTYRALGNGAKAVNCYQSALKMLKAIFGDKPHSDTASTLMNLGNVYCSSEPEKAISYYQPALAMQKKIYHDQPHPEIGLTLMNLGNAYTALGDSSQALHHHLSSLAIYQQVYPSPLHPAVAMTLHGLGHAHLISDQLDKAVESFERSYNTYIATLGPDHPTTQIVKGSLERARAKLESPHQLRS